MNVRSVTRGEAAVALLALLLLVASFLPFEQADGCTFGNCSANSWHTQYFPLLPSVFLAGFIGGGLVVAARFLPRDLRVAGLQVGQWGIALTVFAAWSALWSVFGETPQGVSHGIGAWLGLLFALALAAAAVATALVPALAERLLPEPQPVQTPQQFHGASPAFGSPQQPGAYGYPGPNPQAGPMGGGRPMDVRQPQPYPQPAPAPSHPEPQAQPHPQAHTQPHPQAQPDPAPAQPQVTHAQPDPAAEPPDLAKAQGAAPQAHQSAPEPRPEPQPAPSPTPAPAPAPAPTPEPAPAPAPQPSFAPFWFAVPAVRRLAPEHDPAGPPVGELTPGVWYLAVAERSGALVAQTQDGRRGLLTDTSGIQRG